jgi:hypothetical protein
LREKCISCSIVGHAETKDYNARGGAYFDWLQLIKAEFTGHQFGNSQKGDKK